MVNFKSKVASAVLSNFDLIKHICCDEPDEQWLTMFALLKGFAKSDLYLYWLEQQTSEGLMSDQNTKV